MSSPVPNPAITRNDRPFRFGAHFGWVVAAAFAGLAFWFGLLYFTVRTENDLLRQEQALAGVMLRSAQNQLETERILTTHQLQDTDQRLAGSDHEPPTRNDLARLTISTLTSLPGTPPQAMAVAVWDPASQEGLLRVEKLPALPVDQDYQLWVVDPQYPVPVDGGIFRIDLRTGGGVFPFKADKPIKTVAKFAVSLERRGGAPKAEGPLVLSSH